jgi:HPt (histidine-containing phosphotransfer) domain-containing protein
MVALAVVALLILGMIGLDAYFSEEESIKTSDLVENTQRSIVLLDGIRLHARRLAASDDIREIERWRQVLLADAIAYDPIATYHGERDEWLHLQDLLRMLQFNLANQLRSTPTLEEQIDKSVDDLVAINTAEGKGNASAIRAAHRQAILGDVVAGGIVLVTVAIISVSLLRALARQRKLESTGIFDSQALIDAIEGDRSLAQSVAATFLTNGQALLQVLASHLEANDATQAARQAHTIKGSAASVRGVALAEEASVCEIACKANDLARANSSFQNMTRAMARLTLALEQFCRSPQTSPMSACR